MKSQIKDVETKLPIRGKQRFFDLCAAQSKIYPVTIGPKRSAARFLREAAREKLIKLGFSTEYLKSIV